MPATDSDRDDGPRGSGRRAGDSEGPPDATASAGVQQGVTPESASAANGPTRSVLICDDRADVRQELSEILRRGSQDQVNAVPDGNALLDAYQHTANDQILIGIHSGSTVGSEAITLLLHMHPTAAPIVFGSISDIDLLAAAFDRGVGGLLIWEPGRHQPPNPL